MYTLDKWPPDSVSDNYTPRVPAGVAGSPLQLQRSLFSLSPTSRHEGQTLSTVLLLEEASGQSLPRCTALPLAHRGLQDLLLHPLTFVVAGDPLHAVSKGHFSSNKVSENSDLPTRDGLSSGR